MRQANRVDNPEQGIRRYGPGKFNKVIDAHIYSLSLDGGPDEEIGDAQDFGWYGLMEGELRADVERVALDSRDRLTRDEIKFLDDQVGAIISENSQGFVSVDYYTDEGQMKRDWGRLLSESEEFYDESEEENPGESD